MKYPIRTLASFTLLALSGLSWGQVLKTYSLNPLPEVLELEVRVSSNGESSFYHIDRSSKKETKTIFMGSVLSDYSNKLMMADIDKITCDGQFDYAGDFHGNKYIMLTAVKACTDEDGFIVAHSINTTFANPDELAASIRKIEMNKTRRSAAINENSGVKSLRHEGLQRPHSHSTSRQ